ncbi:MAG: glycoside hydrolase family 3 C-terminal domain-containing protein [Bacilli bacterium]|nr:glycoside hydrolase family 3 C-terminal domain-containing protein [Bacilli bacterium]
MTKEEKKIWRKGMKKAIRPFNGLTIASGIFLALSAGALALGNYAPNPFICLGGDSTSVLKKKDSSAIYFDVDDDLKDTDKRVEHENKLVEQIEAEGATLLTNESNTLPLAKASKVSCFSTSSVNLVYGGTGSAAVDVSKAPTLKTALEESGFKVNDTLWNFYKEGPGKKYNRKSSSMFDGSSSGTGEAPWSIYDDATLRSVEEYGDAAIVVISRVGGEGADLVTNPNYLALDENEKEMMLHIKSMKDDGKIKKIIVLLNSSNAIQLDFLKENRYSVDACLWIGGVGSTGINAVADILVGDVNPSGCLPDTFCYDNFAAPAMKNFKTQVYGGAAEAKLNNMQQNYVVYQEGIYVGYRYFETRYEDYCLEKGNAGNYNYSDEVAFPFGYGLSYTTFKETLTDIDEKEDSFELTVKVENTGSVKGKDTIQIYAQTPYTEYDRTNHIEKSAVILAGFDKVELDAGASITRKITVDKRDLASYDAYKSKSYIYENGTYYFTVADGSHNAINNIIRAKDLLNERADSLGSPLTQVKAHLELLSNETLDYTTSKNHTAITNQFDKADLTLYEGSSVKDTFKYVSRNDWTGTLPKDSVKLDLTNALLKDLSMQVHQNAKTPKNMMPLTGIKYGIKAYEMMGVDLYDAKWTEFIQQMSIDELINFVANGFHLTYGVKSLQLPQTRQENGPQGYTGFFGMGGFNAMAITSCDILAATYNVDLAKEVGRCMGNDCLLDGITGLYGPGNNTHRTPYGGRNFEYYSEDPILASYIALYQDKAILDKGVSVEMKHFVVNDCEENRGGLCTWVNEQTLREIYLKPFQRIIEEDHRAGVMNSYSRIGATWCGAHAELMRNVLRGEWGSTGFNITDNAYFGYMNGVDGVLAGTSLYDAMMKVPEGHMKKAKEDAEFIQGLQEASRYNAYNIVNSAAMNGIGPNTKVVVRAAKIVSVPTTLTVIFSLGFAGCLAMWIINSRKYKQSNTK